MKLFVWADPYKVYYGTAMVFAVAEDLESAKAEAARGEAYAYGKYAEVNPGVALGDPTRIVDLPCAEWHKWQE